MRFEFPFVNLILMLKFFTLLFAICCLLLALSSTPAFAQVESVDFVSLYTVSDKDAVDGDIVSSTVDKGLTRSSFPYDLRVFGVIQSSPLIVYKSVDNAGSPISRSGTATVNVTTLNGQISAGDYITTSEIPGKGQKATASGYVIGIALTPLSTSDGEEFQYQRQISGSKKPSSPEKFRKGRITVALQIQYAELTTARTALRLLDSFNASLFTNIQNPDQFVKIFRYITAIVVVLISFTIGFLTFSRSIPKGIEAIGRNPLAQKAIIFSIIMNVFFTVVVALAGIGAAIIILRF